MNSKTDNLEQLTRELPREIQPPRDLWPDIYDQITAQPSGYARRWLPLALAASLLVAMSSTVTMWVMSPGNGSQDFIAFARQDPTVMTTRYAGAVEAEFAPALIALRAQLPYRLEQLAPETRDNVLQNLSEIDTATQEIRGAIGRDPNAMYLVDMLVALYAREIDILRQLNQTTNPFSQSYSQETQL